MANRKISDLTALTAPATGDLLPIVDISEAAAADKNKKITYGELLASAPAGSAAAPSFSFDGDPNSGLYSAGADQVAIGTSGSQRLVVDASGNLLVGYNSDQGGGKFQVNGAGRIGAIDFNTDDLTYVSGGTFKVGTFYGLPLALKTSNTERLRITAGGLVGVGTSSPGGRFHVKETNTNTIIGVLEGSEAYAYQSLQASGTTAGAVRVGANANDFVINAGSLTRMRITSAGLVGIGTSAPDGLLHVASASAGTVTANGNANELVVENSSTGGISILTPDANHGYLIFGSPSDNEGAIIRYRHNDGIYTIGTEAAGGSIQLRSGSGTTALTIDSSQRVGIGTSSPSDRVHIVAPADTAAYLNIEAGSSATSLRNAGIYLNAKKVTGGTGTSLIEATGTPDGANGSALVFSTESSANALLERLRIDSSGRVGIGTTSPGQALDVVGSINLTGNHIFSTTTSAFIAANAANSVLRFGTGSGGIERARIDSSGRLLVGTSTSVHQNAPVQIVAATTCQEWVAGSNSSGDGVYLFAARSRGTAASRTVVQNGDNLARLVFDGYSAAASTFRTAAEISCWVDGEPDTAGDATDMPGRLVFSTTADGASSPTERLRITSAGLVGVGTSSPGAQIDVVSGTGYSNIGIRSTGGFAVRGDGRVDVGSVSGENSFLSVQRPSGSGITRLAHFNDVDTSTGIAIATSAGFANISALGTTAKLAFGNTGVNTNQLVLDTATGRVGIGTTSPFALLHVKADTNKNLVVQNGGADTIELSNYNAGDGYREVAFGGSILKFNTGTAGSGSSSERGRFTADGKFLVGTSSSPSLTDGQYSKLHVIANTNTASGEGIINIGRGQAASSAFAPGTGLGNLFFTDSAGAVHAAVIGVTDGTTGAGDYPGRLVFATTADGASSPTERMRIDNQGRVETTCVKNDNAAFVVSHNGTSGLQYGIIAITANDQNDTTRYFFRGQGGGTERFTVRSNGGIANYSANNANLSDRNAKKDISPAADTWDCIKEWEIVNYRYKDQADDADLNLGVIAQQVAESCPEVITVFQEAKEATEDQPAQEERLGVKEQQMYWMAIKTLQEAQVRIEALEAEVSALKGA